MRIHLRASTFWLILSAALGSGQAFGQEAVTIPGYKPDPGVQQAYESERRVESDELAWGSSQKQLELGEFQQTMTALARDGRRMRVSWTSVARTPVEVYAVHPSNTLVLTTSDVLDGVPVELEAETAELPAGLVAPDQIRRRIEQRISTTSAAPEKTALTRLRAELDSNPIGVVDDFIPGAELVARRQAEQTVTAKVGDTWEVRHETNYQGVPLQAVTSGSWKSIDHINQTAIMTWTEVVDSDVMTKAMQAGIEQIIALQQAKWNLPDEQLAPLKKARLHSFGRAVVSLRDGSMIEATEVVIREIAGLRQTTRTHIRQLDSITGSSDYDARLKEAQLGQKEREEDLQSAMERSRAAMKKMQQARKIPETASVEGLLGTGPKDPVGDYGGRLPKQLPESVKYSAPVALKVAAATIVSENGNEGLKLVLTPDSAILLGDFTMKMISRSAQVKAARRVIPGLHINEPIISGELNIFGGDIDDLRAIEAEVSSPGATVEMQAVPEALPIDIAKATVVDDPSAGPTLDITLTPASAALYQEFTKAGEGKTANFQTSLLQPVGSTIIDRENDTGNIRLTDLSGGEQGLRRLAEELPKNGVTVAIRPDLN